MVSLIIDRGADINILDSVGEITYMSDLSQNGETPLFGAVALGHTPIVSYLLGCGAHYNHRNNVTNQYLYIHLPL